MTSINTRNRGGSFADTDGISYNGNPQYKKNTKQELYEIIVMTLYGKDSYYETVDTRVTRLINAVNQVVCDNECDFVANAALHARTVMNIRTMPIVLVVEFAKALRNNNRHYDNMRKLVCDVIQRADQITDMYAYALRVFGDKKKIPMAIKRGVADAFNKFNEYQFAKYNSNNTVKMRDVLRIVHPKARSLKQGEIFHKIMEDNLATPYTWETEFSHNGQLPENERKKKSQLWAELVQSDKLGYMAMVRNVRNMIEAGVDDTTLRTVARKISDPQHVEKSGMLPFQFVSAYKAVNQHGNNMITRAISRAIDASLGNLPKLGEHVWIIVDCSGSMNVGCSGSMNYDYRAHLDTVPMETASLFAAALAKANAEASNIRITMFSDSAFHVMVNTDDSVISIAQNCLMEKVQGGGTNLAAALSMKDSLGFEPDTIIVLSDMAVNNLSSKNVSSMFNKDAVKVAINLNAYDSTPISEKHGWYQLAGWSDRLFDFIPAMREKHTMVDVLSGSYMGPDAFSKFNEYQFAKFETVN